MQQCTTYILTALLLPLSVTVRHHTIVTLQVGVGYWIPEEIKEGIIFQMRDDLEHLHHLDYLAHKERMKAVHKRLLRNKSIMLRHIDKPKPTRLIKIIEPKPVDVWRDWCEQQQLENARRNNELIWPKTKDYIYHPRNTWGSFDTEVMLREDANNTPRVTYGTRFIYRFYHDESPIFKEHATVFLVWKQRMDRYKNYKTFAKHFSNWSEEEFKMIKGIYFFRE